MIKRIVYLSSAQGELGNSDIENILESARRNNARSDVTGLLLFHDGCFFQVLEGPPEEVESIFATIQNDHRHVGLIICERSSPPARAFADWSMGFVGANRLSQDQRRSLVDLASLVAGEQISTFASSGPVAVHIESFLRSFREFAPI